MPGDRLNGKTARDAGSGFLFEDLDLDGFEVAHSAKYPNCDAISVETGYSDGMIRRVRVSRCVDAGLDIKGQSWRAEDFTAVGCGISAKWWAPGRDDSIHSERPCNAHIQLNGGGERVIEFLRPISGWAAPIVEFQHRPGVVRALG